MKNIALSFALAIALICGTVVLNYMFPANEKTATVIGDDLSTDDDLLCDIVFDQNGNMLSETTYRWDNKLDTKGDVISKKVIYNNNEHRN